MSLLNNATTEEIQRLLDMFPSSSLKQNWPDMGKTKLEMCQNLASQRNMPTIQTFIADHILCCRQHVYICSHAVALASVPEISLPDSSLIWKKYTAQEKEQVYIMRIKYDFILTNPTQNESLSFLWPFRLTWTENSIIIRFVTLEPNVGSHFDQRDVLRPTKSIDELGIIRKINEEMEGNLSVVDLHRGIKKLWDRDFMDALRVQYKKAHSTVTEAMDAKRGIKRAYPDLYNQLKRLTLINVWFSIPEQEDFSVTAFSARPLEGHLTFPRFSEVASHTDHVVREIIRHN